MADYIVSRLRTVLNAFTVEEQQDIIDDAAAEIERLRAAGNLLWHCLLTWQSKYPSLDIGYDAVEAWEEARRR